MPISSGPNIIGESNLVFNYDTGDIVNSYKGEPTTNLYTYSEQVDQWINGSCVIIPNAAIAPNGTMTADFVGANSVATYHTVYQNIATTSGLTYTFSCYVLPAGGFNGNQNTFFMQTNDGSWKNITFNLSNLSYSATAGTTGFVQALANGWYRVGWTVTIATGGTLTWYIYPTPAPSAETLGGGYYVWGAQLEQKNHATQYLATPSNTSVTRSNTQGLLDISGYNNSISLASTSYDLNAQIVFDGTDDYINVPYNSSQNLTNQGTISTWINPATLTQGSFAGIVAQCIGGSVNAQAYQLSWRQISGALFGSICNGSGTYNDIYTTLPSVANVWYNIVFTWNGAILSMYNNGVLLSQTTQTINSQVLTTDLTIGGYTYKGAGGGGEYFNGKISNVSIYNIGFSAQEVMTNYNQLKTRFNIS